MSTGLPILRSCPYSTDFVMFSNSMNGFFANIYLHKLGSLVHHVSPSVAPILVVVSPTKSYNY